MPMHPLVGRTGAAAGIVASLLLGSSAALAAPASPAVPGAAAVAQARHPPAAQPEPEPAAKA